MRVFPDSLHRNGSYVPRTSMYQLTITNTGYVEIYLNLTITQTGEPTTAVYTIEDTMLRVILPLLLIGIAPVFIIILSAALYRKKRLHQITTGQIVQKPVNPKVIAYVMAGIALLGSQHFYISSSLNEPFTFDITGAFWHYSPNVIPPLEFGFAGEQLTLILGFLFIFEMFRCYQSKSTRKRTLLVGLIGPLWQIIPNILNYLLGPPGPSSPYVHISGPTFLLFLSGLTFLYIFQPPIPQQKWDEDLE